MARFLLLLALCCGIARAAGDPLSPVGAWRTIDDSTHKPKSVVRIVETDGVLSATVEKFLDPAADPGKRCTECSDERKDKPILGMTIMTGLKKDGDAWAGGRILDPENGKTYRCTVTVVDQGRKLEMRGYVGFFFRTQVWERVE